MTTGHRIILTSIMISVVVGVTRGDEPLKLNWENNFLQISGDQVPGSTLKVLYIEAYCRPNSSDREWDKTVIGHTTELISRSQDGHELILKCTLRDGVTVEHVITTTTDEVDFRLTAHNPTDTASEATWAQPCIQVADFTGRDQQTYLAKCFVFVDGELKRLPTEPWAEKRAIHAGPGLGASVDRSRRFESAPDQRGHPEQWADRLLFGRRQHDSGDRLGTLPRVVSRCDHLHS